MGVMSRMSTVVKSKMNRLLDRAEDPRETLDYAYDKQREMLQNVKRGIVEMVTTKRRLQLQAEKVRANIANVDNQARQAMAAGREDLARMALQRKQAAIIEMEGLDQQADQLELGAGEADTRRAAPHRQGRGVPLPKRDNQGPVQRRAGPGQDRIRPLWHLRRDGRRPACRRACREQDRRPPRQGRSDRRACRQRRAGHPACLWVEATS